MCWPQYTHRGCTLETSIGLLNLSALSPRLPESSNISRVIVPDASPVSLYFWLLLPNRARWPFDQRTRGPVPWPFIPPKNSTSIPREFDFHEWATCSRCLCWGWVEQLIDYFIYSLSSARTVPTGMIRLSSPHSSITPQDVIIISYLHLPYSPLFVILFLCRIYVFDFFNFIFLIHRPFADTPQTLAGILRVLGPKLWSLIRMAQYFRPLF